jgi:peroxiredoxin
MAFLDHCASKTSSCRSSAHFNVAEDIAVRGHQPISARTFSCFCLLLFLISLTSTANPAASDKRTQAGNAPELPRMIGHDAPGFTLISLDGKQVSLGQYKGNAVMVNFWATWCGACKLEMPWIAELRDKYSKQGFEVLGIVTNDAPATTVAATARKYGVKYPILACNHAAAQAYGGLPSLPTSFFIDRHGKIVAEMADASSKEEIEEDILKVLGSQQRK